jgi:hypothetical protein
MIELDRHEADGARAYLGDPHPALVCRADFLHRPPLIFSLVRMLSPENLGAHHPLERREDRRPGPQRKVDHRRGISIFKWSNPRLHRFTSRYQKTEPVHTVRAAIARAEDRSGLYCPPSNGVRGTTMRIPYSRHELVDGNG